MGITLRRALLLLTDAGESVLGGGVDGELVIGEGYLDAGAMEMMESGRDIL